MIKPRKRLVDATVAALHIQRTYTLTIAPATVRSWAQRGHITRYDDGQTGAHFDLNEVDRYVRERIARG